MRAAVNDNSPDRLFVRVLSGFYNRIAQPSNWFVLHVFVGGALIIEGWPKIVAPFAQTGFVESIGLCPGWFWSPALAIMQFFGGIALVAGFLARPIALANAIMLGITWWFHYTYPYGDALLTQAGIDALNAGNANLFTPEGIRRLGDGGTAFLHQVQDKAVFLSAIWAIGVLAFAGHGGGSLSVDRHLIKRELEAAPLRRNVLLTH